MAIDGFDRPQHPEYLDYNRRFNEEIGKLPAATAYSAAHKQLNDFIVANPHTTYMGYKADPAVKAQYDALHKALKNSLEDLGAEQLRWHQENPYTGPEPLGYTMGINTDSTVTGGAAGGTTGNAAGGTMTEANTGLLDPSQSTLSPNFSQYVYNMLAKGEQAANLPFQEYTGQRFAGPSALQQQAFQGLGALQTPYQYGMASQMAAGSGQGLQPYSPTGFNTAYQAPNLTPATQFGNMYQAPQTYMPGQFSSGYTAPSLSQATQFSNQFTSPGTYMPGQFSTGLGPVGSVESYMSPYMSAVTDIEGREARRQADISRTAEQARLAQAGAYGGSRQAIMEAERQRNLNQQLGDITSKGLQGAYDRALAQRLKESELGMAAQRGTEESRQFGAQQGMTAAQEAARYGLSAQQAQENARQFQEQQRARGAEFGATQGLEAQRLGETSRQFGAGQGARAAEMAAQYGLSGLQQSESARQFQQQQLARSAEFGSQQAMDAQRQAELSRQFGANYGLQGLQQQLAAARALSDIGTQQYSSGLQGLQAQLGAGATQQQLNQQPLDFGYQQFQESMKYPYQQATYMQSLLGGLPVTARPYQPEQSALLEALKGGLGAYGLLNFFGDTK